MKPIVIPALAQILDPELEEDMSLCPVRALRVYLERTENLRQDKRLLFVAYKPSFSKDIVATTLSGWLMTVICTADAEKDTETLQLFRHTPHSIRGVAATWAKLGGVATRQILEACHWTNDNTFTSYYLQDIAWSDTHNFSLGPIVAAQQIIHNCDRRASKKPYGKKTLSQASSSRN